MIGRRRQRRVEGGPGRRRWRARGAWRVWLTLGVALVAVLGSGRWNPMRDGIVRGSRHALATIRFNPRLWHFGAAWARTADVRVALSDRDGDLTPDRPISADRVVHVQVVLDGASWLSWWPGDIDQLQAVVRTPVAPSLAEPVEAVLAGQPVTIRLSRAATAVRGTSLSGSRTLTLGPVRSGAVLTWGRTRPGVAGAGRVDLDIESRPWLASSHEALCWVAIPQHTIVGLQEMLADLDYLPVGWSAVRACQAGKDRDTGAAGFYWRWPDTPTGIRSAWSPGAYTVATQGAVIQFERVHGLKISWLPSRGFWHALASAWRAGQRDPDPYTYVRVTERLPETLRLWRNGRTILTSLANTGKAPTVTRIGTFPVDLRRTHQVMTGIGPSGKPYRYPDVRWISYFKGSEAIHAFPRAAYGFPQSAGCVELPTATADRVWHDLHYGTLVAVESAGTRSA